MVDESPAESPLAEPVLEPLLKPRTADVRFVDDYLSLIEGITALEHGSGALAVDAERASGFKYSQRAYLIQFHRSGAPILLVDPISILRDHPTAFEEIQARLAPYEWIIHAATQDIPCLAELGLRPQRLFDTELAGRLAGFERVGLGAMVARTMGLQLAKEHSAVDWSTRPLEAGWLNYAALDVDVLPDLRDALEDELRKQRKLDWALQEFERLCSFEPKAPKADRWRGLSGLHSVKQPRDLAVARELWQAREALAQKLDVSPGRLIPDSSILEVVTSKPKSKAELSANKKFSGRASRSYLDLWWDAASKGATTLDLPSAKVASTGIPNHRVWVHKFPEADARLSAARAALAELVETLAVPAENILSPDTLRQVCWMETFETQSDFELQLATLGARSWQIELVTPVLLEVLSPLWHSQRQE